MSIKSDNSETTAKKSTTKTSTTKRTPRKSTTKRTPKKNIVKEEMNNPIPSEMDIINDDIKTIHYKLYSIMCNISAFLMRCVRWIVSIIIVIPLFAILAALFSAIVLPIAMIIDVTNETLFGNVRFKQSIIKKITDALVASYSTAEYGETREPEEK